MQFCQLHKEKQLKVRANTGNKKNDNKCFKESMMKWQYFKGLLKTGSGKNVHQMFSGFSTAQQYNTNQSPHPFAIDTEKIYEHIKPKWQAGAGLEKQ